MADPPDDVIARLNGLIEACKDREEAYRIAANAACNHDLKALLHSYRQQSAGFVAELQAEVKQRGGVPTETGSWTGWLTCGWQHLTAVISGDDAVVIRDCERGEDAVRAAYEATLAAPMPPDVRVVVERQYAAVKAGHDRLRALHAVATEPT